LNAQDLQKFWDVDHEFIAADINDRLISGRGVRGVVDPKLAEDIQQLNK
jgi:hypothetical protein